MVIMLIGQISKWNALQSFQVAWLVQWGCLGSICDALVTNYALNEVP